MPHTPDSVLEELKRNKYAPVYFLQGEEPYFIDTITNYIEQHAIPEANRSFNQVILYGKDAPVNVILTQAKRFPMMSERQVVIVKEAQNIPDIEKEVGQKILLDYLANPMSSTILVFCFKHKTLDKRKALGKSIEKYTVAINAKKVYENQLPAWIVRYMKSRGFEISQKATLMLADHIGNDLERLANEMEKILINYNQPEEITPDVIQRYVGISKDFNIFELQKALIIKDVLKANRILNYFAANPRKNPIFPIIAMLFTFYSKLLMAHHAKDKSEKGLASHLKVSPYFIKDYVEAMHHYSLAKVTDNIHFIHEADLQSKHINYGSLDEEQILKELVFKLLH